MQLGSFEVSQHRLESFFHELKCNGMASFTEFIVCFELIFPGDVVVRSPAAIYTYSRTRGLFAGISVEGSALIERKDANRKYA